MKKPATAAESRYMGRVSAAGCVICGEPAAIHHPRFAAGMGQRASNWLAIGLCFEHHQGELSIHGNKRQFEALFGTEERLLAKTIELVFSGV
jgi:hypothetical protein